MDTSPAPHNAVKHVIKFMKFHKEDCYFST